MDEPENAATPAADTTEPTDRVSRTRLPMRMSRRSALLLGIVGVTTAAVGLTTRTTPAYADQYPSWADVVAAKSSQAATAAEISHVTALIRTLQNAAAQAQQTAHAQGDAFFTAQQAFVTADARTGELQAQADAALARARTAATQAGQVAAQLYQDGGDDATLQLLMSGSAADADQLLARLDVLHTVLGDDNTVYMDAVAARDSAQNLAAQARRQRRARDRLQRVADRAMSQAQAASTAATAAAAAVDAHLIDLQAQLTALRSSTTKTVAQYEAGVRAEQAQQALAAQQARQRAAALAQQEAQQARQPQPSQQPAPQPSRSRPAPPSSPPAADGWVRPTSGPQTAGYGWRILCIYGSCGPNFHPGVDLAPGCGFPIVAAHSGTVVYAGWNGGYGNYIRIDNGDGTPYGTGYGHIRDGGILVQPGQHVSTGQVIAYIGSTGYSTGCHLHFEVYVNGVTVNPIPFMAARGVSV